ncbi:MAG TPA: hypothetical protein VFR86_06710 [Burkholderiaceae bacterium]|nr:hypothetical protein [Burkholderiaceae bacterium]
MFVPRRTRRLAGPVVALARAPDDPSLALGAALAAALREQLIVLAESTPKGEDDIARAARRAAGGGCVTLGLGGLSARSWLAALRHALRSYRERLLILSRGADEDAAPYFDLATERGVPLLMVGT